jgi:hypothetical protein
MHTHTDSRNDRRLAVEDRRQQSRRADDPRNNPRRWEGRPMDSRAKDDPREPAELDKPRTEALTLRVFVETIYWRKRTLRPRTREDHLSTLNVLDKFAERPVLVRDLSDDFAERFARWFQEFAPATRNRGRGRAANTARKQLANLLAWWRLACRRRVRQEIGRANWPAHRPEIEKPAREKRIPEAWTLKDYEAALDAAGQLDGRVCGVPRSDWWASLLLVIFYTGERITAVMLTRESDFDEAAGTILFRSENTKDAESRLRKLPPEAVVALQRVRESRVADWTAAELQSGHRRLLPWPHDPAGRWKTLRRHLKLYILRPAKLTTSRWLFHKMRATHATLLENAGGNPSESLGHSTPELYKQSYRDTRLIEAAGPDTLLPKPQYKRQLTLIG